MKTSLFAIALGCAWVCGTVACSNNVNGGTDGGDTDHTNGDPNGGDNHGGDPSGGDTTDTDTGDNDTGASQPVIAGCAIFPADHIFNTRIDDITKFPVDTHSESYKDTIKGEPPTNVHVHLDLGTSATGFGIPYNIVSGNTLTWTHVIIDNDGTDDDGDESDCARDDDATHAIMRPCTGDTQAHAVFPIPANPNVEGVDISTDPVDSNGDAHMLLLDKDTCKLWEVGQTRHAADGWHSAWDAAWDLTSNALRPADWTSADAAGFPILPLLAKADEAATGTITHALRFTIHSDKIRELYVWPARHLTHNGGDVVEKPPMGQLFRLKASTPMPAGATVKAQAVVNALKQYGMYLADGGSDMFISGAGDDGWDSDTIDAVQTLTVDDFEAVSLDNVTQNPNFDPDSAAVP